MACDRARLTYLWIGKLYCKLLRNLESYIKNERCWDHDKILWLNSGYQVEIVANVYEIIIIFDNRTII